MRTSIADERILMKHGAGGRAMRRLIEEVLTAGLDGELKDGDIGLGAMDDKKGLTYRDSGVDIDAQDTALSRIKKIARSTATLLILRFDSGVRTTGKEASVAKVVERSAMADANNEVLRMNSLRFIGRYQKGCGRVTLW